MNAHRKIWYPTSSDVVYSLNRMVPIFFPNYEGASPDFRFIGGDQGKGLLESSLARPKPLFGVEKYPSIADKAASLIWSITKNHPFNDGNKRSALTTAVLFLFFNGYFVLADNESAVEMCLAVARPECDFEGATCSGMGR